MTARRGRRLYDFEQIAWALASKTSRAASKLRNFVSRFVTEMA
jgi:hypothetical protein